MFRVSKVVTAVIVAGTVLLGHAGQAAAQTPTTTSTVKTTTTSSTSTSTTLLPHPFSDATAACIRQARSAFKDCLNAGTEGSTCSTQFQTDFANCFAAGAGVSCAKKCVTKEQTCVGSAPTTKKTCRQNCVKTHRADVRACRRIADGDTFWAAGDAACLATADGNFSLCRFVCTEAELSCRIALRFCVANCANL